MSEHEIATTAIVGPDQLARQIEIMADKGVTPQVLEQYMAIWERADARRATADFAAAMASVQAEVPTVVKDAENTHTRSMYARLETVQRAIKPVYLRHGFTISFGEAEPPRENWARVVATVRHIGGHTETYHRDGPMDNLGPQGKPCKSELHGMQSAVSYLQRNLLCSIFGVTVANEDNDGGGVPETITEDQAIVLDEMFEGFQAPADERANFLSIWAKVDRLADLPASRYEMAVKAVRKKLEGMKR